jgi:hypothetical protein
VNNVQEKIVNNTKQKDLDTPTTATTQIKVNEQTNKLTQVISIKLFHSNLIEQVFKKLELISINSLLVSQTAASSFLNSYDNNFCSKNFSINPRMASGEEGEHFNRDDECDVNFLSTTRTNYSIGKSFTLTRKYSSKEQQKEHDQQKRQSIKSHSSLKNLSNIGAGNGGCGGGGVDGYTSTNSLSLNNNKDAVNALDNPHSFNPNKFKYRKAKSAATPYSSHKLKRIFRNHSSSSGTSPSVTVVNTSFNQIPQVVNATSVKANKNKSKTPLSSVVVPLENEKAKCENNFLNLTSNDKSVSLVNVTTTPVHKSENIVETNNNNNSRHESRYIKSTRYQKLQPKSISSVIPMPTITQSFRMDSLEKENSVSSINSISKANISEVKDSQSNHYKKIPTPTPHTTAAPTTITSSGLAANYQAKKLSNQHLNLLKVTPSQSMSAASMSRSSSKRQMTYLDNTSIYQNEYSIDTNDPVASHVYSQNVSKKTGDNVSIISSKLSLLKRTVSFILFSTHFKLLFM